MVMLGQYNPILGVILGQYNPIIGMMLVQYNPILGVILGFIKPKIGFGRTFPVWEIPTEITNITLKFTIFNPGWELKKIPCANYQYEHSKENHMHKTNNKIQNLMAK